MSQYEKKEKGDYCTDCVLVDAEMILPQTGRELDILVVSSFPFVNGYDPKTYVGEFGETGNKLAKNVLAKTLGEQKLRVGYTYAIKCVAEAVQFRPDTATYHKCSYFLKTYADKCAPKVIITLGVQPFKALEFRIAKLGDVRGRIHKFGTAMVVPTFHPIEILKTPGKMELFKKDIALAASIALGTTELTNLTIYTPTTEDDVVAQLDDITRFINAKAEETGRPWLVSVDTETTGLKPYVADARVIMMSMSWETDKGIAFPYRHRLFTYTDKVYDAVKAFFENPNMTTVYHNAKFDIQWLTSKYGLKTDNIYWDSLLAEHLVDEDKKGNYSLKDLTCLYFPSMGKYEEELKLVLAEAKAVAVTEYQTACSENLHKVIHNWCDAPNSELAAAWVDCKYISLTEAAELTNFKVNKRTGKITKATATKLGRIFKKVPEFPVPEIRQVTFEDIEVTTLLRYAAIDALMTRKLVYPQSRECIRDSKKTRPLGIKPLTWALHNISIPLTKILAEVEYNGIRVDREKIADFKKIIEVEIGQSAECLYREVGRKFNHKAAVVKSILFEELGLPVLMYTKTGEPSTDADTLAKLYTQTSNPVVKALLRIRKFEKVYKTYLTAWEVMSTYDGKLHTQFNQTNVATHRLSSSNPNLQNVPFYLPELNMNLKSIFIPDSTEYDLYDVDISNAEMRVLCAYSLDPTLISVFNDGLDVHCLTAEGISEFSYADIVANKDDKQSPQYVARQISKKINFGTIYCMSGMALQEQLLTDLGIEKTLEEAQAYLDAFFVKYPLVLKYINDTKDFTLKNGYTWTFTGHRRRFPLLDYDKSRGSVSRAMRQAVNARIQTTSADLVNLNIVQVAEAIRPLGGRILLTVHDSIVFQMPKGTEGVGDLLDKAITGYVQETFPEMPVTWKYDVGKGPNYGEAH